MPFITEEIWQRMKPLLGIEGDSIMIQPFPAAGPTDEVAEQATGWLQEVLLGIRRIRSDLNLAPALELAVHFQGGDATDREYFAQFEPVLTGLARAGAFRWLDNDVDTSKSAVALIGGLKVLIPLEGLVDVQSEFERIGKLLGRERKLLQQSRAKMGNKRFVENAPPAVVAQEQERLEAHASNVQRFEDQIARLENLSSE
jgi:valyl-tRNA synthetase